MFGLSPVLVGFGFFLINIVLLLLLFFVVFIVVFLVLGFEISRCWFSFYYHVCFVLNYFCFPTLLFLFICSCRLDPLLAFLKFLLLVLFWSVRFFLFSFYYYHNHYLIHLHVIGDQLIIHRSASLKILYLFILFISFSISSIFFFFSGSKRPNISRFS